MEKIILAIYDLLDEKDRKGDNDPKKRVAIVFEKLDTDQNGSLSEEEFVSGCLNDPVLMGFITPNA